MIFIDSPPQLESTHATAINSAHHRLEIDLAGPKPYDDRFR
jgi:hypothetical protein